MSKATFELVAELREDQGKGASRRLRRSEDKIPAILYGGNEQPSKISLEHKKVIQATEHEAFYSHILTLSIAGKNQKAVLKDLQRHPYKKSILHMDFQRVTAKDVITMHVPLHFINEDLCPGAKAGGIISHHTIDIEIRCQASKLPEFIEVDLANLELDNAIHLSDLQLPEGLELPSLKQHNNDANRVVVSVNAPRISKADEDEAATAEPSDATNASTKDDKKK